MATVSWRDHLEIHPAANLFPMMSEPELRELGKDIKRNGLKNPIILWNSGDNENQGKLYLLDGRNRLDAMEAVGIPLFNSHGDLQPDVPGPFKDAVRRLHANNLSYSLGGSFKKPIIEFDPDPYEYVISANIHRRHLTAEQKRDLIGKLLKAKPGSSNLQVAKQVKADDKTVASVRRELEGRSEIPNVKARTDTKGRKQPARKKKQLSNVGRLMVRNANGKSRPATKEEQALFFRMGMQCGITAALKNPINIAWREGSEFNRANFVQLYLPDVLKIAEQIKLAGQLNDDGQAGEISVHN